MQFTFNPFIWNTSFWLFHPTWHMDCKVTWCSRLHCLLGVGVCALTITFCPVFSCKDFSAKLKKRKKSLYSLLKSFYVFLGKEAISRLGDLSCESHKLIFLQDSRLLWYFNHLGLWQGLSDSLLVLLLSHRKSSAISKLIMVKIIILLAEVSARFYKARIEVLNRNIIFSLI